MAAEMAAVGREGPNGTIACQRAAKADISVSRIRSAERSRAKAKHPCRQNPPTCCNGPRWSLAYSERKRRIPRSRINTAAQARPLTPNLCNLAPDFGSSFPSNSAKLRHWRHSQ